MKIIRRTSISVIVAGKRIPKKKKKPRKSSIFRSLRGGYRRFFIKFLTHDRANGSPLNTSRRPRVRKVRVERRGTSTTKEKTRWGCSAFHEDRTESGGRRNERAQGGTGVVETKEEPGRTGERGRGERNERIKPAAGWGIGCWIQLLGEQYRFVVIVCSTARLSFPGSGTTLSPADWLPLVPLSSRSRHPVSRYAVDDILFVTVIPMSFSPGRRPICLFVVFALASRFPRVQPGIHAPPRWKRAPLSASSVVFYTYRL